MDKLQITTLKFGGDWILYSEVSEFRFYPLEFGMFGFYTLTFQNLDFTPLKFRVVWILHPQFMQLLSVKSKYFKTLESKIQILLKYKK